jgi:hygromycin-B 7''-O-kinase
MAVRVHELSKRLGPLSEEQIQRALNRFDLGTLTALAPVSCGLFGQNIFVSSSRGEYVFRGAPLAPWQFRTEQFFTRLLHERTSVPMPWPYLIDESSEFFEWGYAIMPRMPGLQVTDRDVKRTLTKSDRFAIVRAMAKNLAAMHQLTMPHCMRFDADASALRVVRLEDHANWPFIGKYGTAADPPSLHEIVVARVHRIVERSRVASESTTESDVAWVESLIERAQPALAESFTPQFVMEDYKEGNVVLQRTSEGEWAVSGVFDLMGCYFGDGEADLSRTSCEYFDEDPALARAFIETYLALRPSRPGFAQRFPLYVILDRLMIWEYIQRYQPEVARGLGSLRQWTERYTLIAETLGIAPR